MLLLRDANAGVPDPDAEEYLVGNDRDGNLALFCILYGVVDKVADSFRSPFFIEYGGQIIHASNSRDGIKISSAYYRQPLKIGRVM